MSADNVIPLHPRQRAAALKEVGELALMERGLESADGSMTITKLVEQMHANKTGEQEEATLENVWVMLVITLAHLLRSIDYDGDMSSGTAQVARFLACVIGQIEDTPYGAPFRIIDEK